MSNGECRYGRECSTFKTGKSHPEYGVHTSRWSHTTRSGPSSDANANNRGAGNRPASAASPPAVEKKAGAVVKSEEKPPLDQRDLATGLTLCPVFVENGVCPLVALEPGHKDQLLHKRWCPVEAAGDDCKPLWSIDATHFQLFAHFGLEPLQRIEKPSCPNCADCRLAVIDKVHAQQYRHACAQGEKCRLYKTDQRHRLQYLHPCPFDLRSGSCGLKIDEEHLSRFYHPNSDEDGLLLIAAPEGATACRHRSNCRMMLNAMHPQHKEHCAAFWHPPAPDKDQFAAWEPARKRVHEKHCKALKSASDCPLVDVDPSHKFLHVCPSVGPNKQCKLDTSDVKHYEKHIHPCPNGFHCNVPDERHRLMFFHYEAALESRPRDECPLGYECNERTVTNGMPESLGLSSAGDRKVEPMSDRDYALHKLLFTHPCEFGDDCPKKGDKAHTRISHHPQRKTCPHPTNCQISSRAHRKQFLHPCAEGLSCKHVQPSAKSQGNAEHMRDNLHVCPDFKECVKLAAKDATHLRRYVHTDRFPKFCDHVQNCKHVDSGFHLDQARHKCSYWKQCRYLESKGAEKDLHMRRFLHPCEDGLGCAKMADKEHAFLYQHPCDKGDECDEKDLQHWVARSHPKDDAVNGALTYPDGWIQDQKTDPWLFVLNPNSRAYKTAADKFTKSIPSNLGTIVKIEQFQSTHLFTQYAFTRANIKQRIEDAAANGVQPTNPKDPLNEKLLFHGTKPEVAKLILGEGTRAEGFNYRRAGAGNLGQGIYFARAAKSSAHTMYVGDGSTTNGELVMLLCKVVLGNTTPGNSTMRRPPLMSDNATLYNSVYGVHGNAPAGSKPWEYCLFADDQCYPLYKITFKKVGSW